MKKVLALSLILVFCVAGGLMAQQRQGAITLSGMAGNMLTMSDDDMGGNTYSLGIGYMFGDLWSAELGFGAMDIEFGDYEYYQLDLLYHINPENRVVPYVVFGAGSADYDTEFGDGDDGMLFNAGMGFNYSLSRMVNLRGDARYVSTDTDILDSGIHVQMGLGLQFGGKDRPVQAGIEPIDRDMDGVNDSIDYCWDTPPRVKVDSRGCPLDTDGDGTPDYLEDDDADGVINYDDQCADTPEGYPVDTVGCPLDSDKDGIFDGKEKLIGTDPNKADTDDDGLSDMDELKKYKTDPLKADSDGDGCKDGKEVMEMKTDPLNPDSDGDGFNDCDEVMTYKTDPNAAGDVYEKIINSKVLYFDFNKFGLSGEATPVLDEISQFLTKSASIRLLIKGHTDWIGPKWYNDKLSLKRAEATKKYLVEKGLGAERIDTVGFGENNPAADNKTKEGQAKNRRVEFEVIK